MNDLLHTFEAHASTLLAEIQQIVELESPSTDKSAVDRLGAVLRQKLAALGCDIDVIPNPRYADAVVGRWAPPTKRSGDDLARPHSPIGSDSRPVLLLSHMDTVWPVGTLRERPYRVEAGRAYGPGIFDMKSGLVFSIFALQLLQQLDRAPRRPLVYLFTGDEEIGSPSSRSIIERFARESAATLCFEPSTAGAIKTERSGWGRFEMRITGRAAHAGGAHQQGINALEELARQILDLHAMTDYGKGITVTVCMGRGGTRPNVIPDEATATIDLRARSPEALSALAQEISGRAPQIRGAAVEVTGGVNRPPFVRTPEVVGLFKHAQTLAEELGFAVEEGSTGGVSDGNFTTATGCPTLDGIGGFGDGAHALHEHVVVEELPRRCALVARLLETL
ncbi:MAG TPA: M20 family metallopeptidase [Tepidiformaceae bacterium]|nr:M20 family metallopeptidase [Tepidiformaceae bacterium]